MKTYFFDIFVAGRYKTTVRMQYPATWAPTGEELVRDINNKYPSLRSYNWSIN